MWKMRLIELKSRTLSVYKVVKGSKVLDCSLDLAKQYCKVEIRSNEPTKFM